MAFIYLVDGETDALQLSYGELDRRARAVGAWLQARGLEGQRALLLYPPGLDFIVGFFGCLYAGVMAVTAFPPRQNRSLARIQGVAADAGAEVALTTGVVFDRVSPWLDEAPDLRRLEWLCTECAPEGIEARWQAPVIDGQTLAFLQYTSGSTGMPKGVMLTHRNLLHNSALIERSFEHDPESNYGVFWLPSYHDMGLVGGILQPLFAGGQNVLISPMAFLQKPIRWLQAITRYRATTSGAPNFAYDLCLRKIAPHERDTLDLSSWQVAFNGAEPVRVETLERFAEYFAPCGFRREAFYPCYGLAEATLIVSGGKKSAPPIIRAFDARSLEHDQAIAVETSSEGGRKLVGCGTTLGDQQIAIVDPQTLHRRAECQVGEIWVSGPSIAQGYWQRELESEQTFRARIQDTGEGPFLRTGDLGFLHQGELFVTGRIKDLIIVHGVNHYPQDIELTIEHCDPALRPNSGAAFTIEAQGRSQMIVVQEVERGHQDDATRLVELIRTAVAREHEVPLDVVILVKAGSIPKTSSGKIQRHACRQAYFKGHLKTIALWRAESAASIPRVIPTAAHHEPANGAERRVAKNGTATQHAVRQSGAGGHAPGTNGTAQHGRKPPAHEAHRNGGAKPPTAKATHTATVVMDLVRSVAGNRAGNLSLDTSLAQIGLDSLERIELQALIEEHFGGRIPEEVGPQLETIREIVAAVEQYLGREAPPARPAEIGPEAYRFELFPEIIKLQSTINLLEGAGLVNPYFNAHEGLTQDTTIIDGQRLINFSTFNYLSMSGDSRVSQAAQEAIDLYGTSASASRLVSGEKLIHRELEQALAALIGTETAIAFISGHTTNVNTIGHLFGQGDLILHDALAHNSIVQGAILSGAKRRPFPHNDWQALDRLLADLRPKYRRVLLAIEGAYSMDGDIADVPAFIQVKRRHKAVLLVDEAHSIGVLGARGRGVSEHFGIPSADVELWMGTLSKALGSTGGYIAASRTVVEYLKYTSPGFVFSTGLCPAQAAAAARAVQLLIEEPERVRTLHRRAALFLELAKARGLNTGLSQGTPIIPIILGNSMHSLQLSRALFERGINVQPILHPAVEESASRLRFFITSSHTEEQIRYAVACLAEEAERIDPRHVSGAGLVRQAPEAIGAAS